MGRCIAVACRVEENPCEQTHLGNARLAPFALAVPIEKLLNLVPLRPVDDRLMLSPIDAPLCDLAHIYVVAEDLVKGAPGEACPAGLGPITFVLAICCKSRFDRDIP